MAFNLSKRPGVKIGIDMADYCDASERTKIDISVIRAVDEIESAGSGFLISNGRPKILFEGHYFYKFMAKHGVAEKARRLEPSICYPKWTKVHYVGREGEYARIAKATELCFKFDLSDALALQSASWGRYQIMGDNFRRAGFDSVFAFVEAMFLDEDNHLEAFIEYIDNTFLIDELQKLPSSPGRFAALFAHGYNGAGYRRNAYDTKIVNAWKKFSRQKIDCRSIPRGNVQVVAAMPGIRDTNPDPNSVANTSLDDRYIDIEAIVSDPEERDGTVLDLGQPDPEIFPELKPGAVIAADDPGSGSQPEPENSNQEGGATPAANQTADQILNIGQAPEAKTKVDAAKEMDDTVVDTRANTGFLAKVTGVISAILTGQYVFPEFLQNGLSNINILDLFAKVIGGIWHLRYIIFGALALWFLINQIKDYQLKHKVIDTNTDPEKGNVVLVGSTRVGIWEMFRRKIVKLFGGSPEPAAVGFKMIPNQRDKP